MHLCSLVEGGCPGEGLPGKQCNRGSQGLTGCHSLVEARVDWETGSAEREMRRHSETLLDSIGGLLQLIARKSRVAFRAYIGRETLIVVLVEGTRRRAVSFTPSTRWWSSINPSAGWNDNTQTRFRPLLRRVTDCVIARQPKTVDGDFGRRADLRACLSPAK